jgi:hypothetical protein
MLQRRLRRRVQHERTWIRHLRRLRGNDDDASLRLDDFEHSLGDKDVRCQVAVEHFAEVVERRGGEGGQVVQDGVID